MSTRAQAGLGDPRSTLTVFIANRPELEPYTSLGEVHPLALGELAHITANTSNHWRKVFNVFAKFLFALGLRAGFNPSVGYDQWQDYRDQQLLQAGSDTALLFSPPDLAQPQARAHAHPVSDTAGKDIGISIVTGKTYAAQLGLQHLTWLDGHFAVNRDARLIVCPYFDYRQLSNARIGQLVEIVTELQRPTAT